jgi:three-Cys-motif partner protein
MEYPTFKFDEIGDWSKVKLDIIEKYGQAYTKAFSKKGSRLTKIYIDGFSGSGLHIDKNTGDYVTGSPARALTINPKFDKFHFIDLNADKAGYLSKICKGRSDVNVVNGDANIELMKIMKDVKFENYTRALCVLDPYGLHLNWDILFMAGQSKAVDLFLNFPVMDINRNAIWRDQQRVPEHGLQRMDRFWGDRSWAEAAYASDPQGNLLWEPAAIKQPNAAIATAFQSRLKKVAGFNYVPTPLPLKNSANATVYYLFFASNKPVAEKIVSDIFSQY